MNEQKILSALSEYTGDILEILSTYTSGEHFKNACDRVYEKQRETIEKLKSAEG